MLFAPGRKRRPGLLLSVLAFLVLIGIVLGLNALNNRYVTLTTENLTLAGLDRQLEGFKILHLSDLHGLRFGMGQERIREAIRLENYGAVCLTGDMVGESGDPGALLELIGIMPKDVPVYFISGDDDPQPLNTANPDSVNAKADYIVAAEAAGAIYLDSPQRIRRGSRSLWFIPANLYTTDLQAARFALNARREELLAAPQSIEAATQLRAVAYQLQKLEETQLQRQEMHPADSYVLLSHVPPDAELVSAMHRGEGVERQAVNFPGTVGLVLAGHWNDGQWRLPLLGQVLLPERAKAFRGWVRGGGMSGIASVHGVLMYVSPGMGVSSDYPWQPFRLFNRPRISLLKLSAVFQ